METQFVGALELLGDRAAEIGLGVEPGDFVFVLIGHHLEQRARATASVSAVLPGARAASAARSRRTRAA